eukprot:CAMPEP_0201987232 /NCGR_PEP_ID=MMETSP0904-20121228/91691_1 /ASSEMBLY_ACC=CAM_ASM_000553 /TAXON_ID=420261 /ORGANISM="Thalassiosira antarctica, Strain CCMP982" /LENGTH=160 /DNA_ID=CAMNT_0048541335 /DNA_START=695 /DNA_END=1178 /DNA_ORIENTATION=+
MGLTLGMLDTKEGAAMRNTVEKRKIRQANTKASRKRAVLMSLGATNGLAAAWSHARAGLGAGESRCQWGTCSTQADDKWFSEDAGFQSAIPKSSYITFLYTLHVMSLLYLSATLSLGALKRWTRQQHGLHARAGLGAGESRCQWGTCSTQADTKWFSEDA